ncbi:hypothetical protein KY285_001959 [Solanum tuberosum]|nr:hypothetical protein KY285_001959 [Solanum tuberosum]
MELMKDPVTISTGVTYERKNIEKWFYTCKKKTCPTTMQVLHCFDMTPNHTLKRLILAWQNGKSQSHDELSMKHDELVSLINTIESSPFKVSSLKKLKSIVELGDHDVKDDFKKCGGVEVLVRIIQQILIESSDFVTFRACEEALSLLIKLPIVLEEEETIKILLQPGCMKSMAIILQRGSEEARFCTVSILQRIMKSDCQWSVVIEDQGIEFFKSLMEIMSDEICSKASSCALQVLIDILEKSKKSRLKAIEAGAMCTLIEILPDSSKSKSEKIMYLIKMMCECADGRMGFIEHGLDKVLDDLLMYGSVKKLVALLHIGGSSTTKERVIKILKLHGDKWKKNPCFPYELKNYLGLESDSL